MQIKLAELMKLPILKPFSKKIASEIMSDPYQSLIEQVNSMKERMSQAQEKLQSIPLPKQADMVKGDMTPSEILEDIEMGLAVLENKVMDNGLNEEICPAMEEMEKLLESVESKLEPVEKKAAKSCPICEMQDMIKENGNWVCPQCQYTLPIREEQKEAQVPNPAMGTPIPPTPQVNQPTDEENLDVPVPAPTSPAAPGFKWIYDPVNKKYISMPDASLPLGKTI